MLKLILKKRLKYKKIIMKARENKKKRFQFSKIITLNMLVLNFILVAPLIANAQLAKVNSNIQNSEVNSKIILIDDNFNEFQSKNEIDKTKILSFIKNPQPSLYLNSEGLKKYGEMPVCLYSQAKFLVNNFNLKKTENFNSLEIIIIKIEDLQDLNSEIDVYEFYNYLKLKYIYILSNIECTEKDIQGILKNNNSRFNILYSIKKPS